MARDNDINILLDAYDKEVRTYDAFRVVAESVVRELVRLEGISVHSVTSRTKRRESFEEKLGRDSKGDYENLLEITDLVGVRVITYIEDDVDRVGGLIRREFEVDDENSVDKRQILDANQFGYLSLHFVCSFDDARTSLAENKRFKGLKFELQVRSILQHAWAEIEHDLGYKSGASVPRPLRRRFSRLAGLLEIADTEFMRLRDELSAYAEKVQEEIVRKPEEVPLDDVSLTAYIANSKQLRDLDEKMASVRGAVLMEKQFPELASMLQAAGIATVQDLESRLQQYKDVVLKQWVTRSGSRKGGSVRSGIGLFHLAQVLWYIAGEESFKKAIGQFGFSGSPRMVDAIRSALAETSG